MNYKNIKKRTETESLKSRDNSKGFHQCFLKCELEKEKG